MLRKNLQGTQVHVHGLLNGYLKIYVSLLVGFHESIHFFIDIHIQTQNLGIKIHLNTSR